MMMLKSEFLIKFCRKCQHDQEHLIITYDSEITRVCQVCLSSIKWIKKEAVVPSKYVVMSTFEVDRNSKGRRWVMAEIQKTAKPAGFTTKSSNETITTFRIKYPAWEKKHYISSLTDINDRSLPYSEAMAIAKELKLFMGIKT